MNYKELLTTYETDVQFPDVSGMEHLEMLMARSEIARYEKHLTDEGWQRLAQAGSLLMQHAAQFYEAIHKVADLAAWRQDENVPVTHWWWFLDVVTQMPIQSLMPGHFSRSDVYSTTS